MVSRTAWTAGNGVGYTWTALLSSGDMASMATANTVLSGAGDITNQSAQDIFMDISYALAISSNTIAAGANFAFWLYALNQDGTHYGDNQLTAGSPAALTPAFPPCAVVGIPAVATTTNMYGFAQQIIIPPGTFRVAMQNNSGFTLTSGTQTVKYRTYNLNLNN